LVKKSTSSHQWSLPDNRLIRLTFGFNKCSKQLLLVLILPHTFNKFLEGEVLLKERRKNKMMEVQQLLKLKLQLKLRHKHKHKRKLKLMQRKLKENVKLRLRRLAKDKPKRKSNSVWLTSNKSKNN
jgi:hypothetical protein